MRRRLCPARACSWALGFARSDSCCSAASMAAFELGAALLREAGGAGGKRRRRRREGEDASHARSPEQREEREIYYYNNNNKTVSLRNQCSNASVESSSELSELSGESESDNGLDNNLSIHLSLSLSLSNGTRVVLGENAGPSPGACGRGAPDGSSGCKALRTSLASLRMHFMRASRALIMTSFICSFASIFL